MAKRRITTFKLEEEIHSKLQKANMKMVEDVFAHSFLQLMTLLRLSHTETEELLFQLSSACVPPVRKVCDLLELESRNVIKLGDSHLDEILQGGIKKGALTEFIGPPGVGKTQMCLHLALNCLRMESTSNAVCFIDTEGALRFERLLQMLEADPRVRGKEREMAARFHVLQPKTVDAFSQILQSLEILCIEKNVGLVVVDSVASLARKEFSQDVGLERAAVLASWAAQFKALADQLKIAVVVTNHVTSRFSEDSDEDTDEGDEQRREESPKDCDDGAGYFIGPALGGTWTHFVNTRVILQFLDEEARQFIVAKSPVAPVAVKSYYITHVGVEFFGELRYTFSGMNTSRHRITVQPALS